MVADRTTPEDRERRPVRVVVMAVFLQRRARKAQQVSGRGRIDVKRQVFRFQSGHLQHFD